MWITLKNFRCYEDRTFNFELDKGLILISADSGAGKSTILMGIYFCLFGVGTKVTTLNKTKCMVEMNFDGMKIVRTKCPNRLVVDDVYEDAVAQEIINNKFSTTFGVTGYIAQNAVNSFIMMGPTDKLAFLEKFAFKDVNLEQIKNDCKRLIAKRNETLIETTAQLKMATDVLDNKIKPNLVYFPIKCKISQRPIAIKNHGIKIKNNETRIRATGSKISKKKQEIDSLKNVLKATEYDNDNIAKNNSKVYTLEQKIYKNEYIGDESLEMYKNILINLLERKEQIQLKKDHDVQKQKLTDMYDNEMKDINDELKRISDNICDDEEYETIQTDVEYLEQKHKDWKMVEKLNSSIMDIVPLSDEFMKNNDERLLTLTQSIENAVTILKCPCCDNTLTLKSKKLVKCDNNAVDIRELRKELEMLKKDIEKSTSLNRKYNTTTSSIKEIKDFYQDDEEHDNILEVLESLKNLQNKKDVQQNFRTLKKNIIENETLSSSYRLQLKSVNILKDKLDKLDDCKHVCLEKEEDVRTIINKAKQDKISITRINSEINEIKQMITNIQTHIETINKEHNDIYSKMNNIVNVMTRLTQLQTDMNGYTVIKEELEKVEIQIKVWEKYDKDHSEYMEWHTKKCLLSDKEQRDKYMYGSSITLKEKILEAESIAVHNIIDSINNHAQLYLDVFFVSSPITITLQPFKKTAKSTKPQINVQVDYKGMTTDLSILSGGETARVVIAYTLALAEMFNTPMILLDECTAGLDQDLSNTIFSGIKEHFNDKLVLAVAHQAVTGIFDKTITL